MALRVVYVLLRELRAAVKDRLYLTAIFVLPWVMILFFVAMFFRGSIEELPVAVVDDDGSAMSRRLTMMLDASSGLDMERGFGSMIDAERAMLRGEVAGIIYIPDGFEANILGGVITPLECYVSGDNISTSGVVQRDVQQVVTTFSAGVTLNRLQAQGVGEAEAMVDVMPVNYHEHILSNPNINYGYYLAPVFMFLGVLIFTTLATVYSFGRELRYALVDDWLATVSNSFRAAVLGKLLFVAVVMSLYMQVVYVIIFDVMGMECLGSRWVLDLASLLFVLASEAVALAIIALVANLRLGLSLGGGYAVMSFTFSGITFPTMAMYGVAAMLSYLFPLNYFSRLFISVATLGAPSAYWIGDVFALLLFCMFIPLSWWRLKRVVLNSQYWGRD